jgi:hypothetical protein
VLTLATIALLTGVLLGKRFKVLVLVPTVVLAAGAILAGSIAHHEAGSITLAMLIAAVGLQVGYLGGLVPTTP